MSRKSHSGLWAKGQSGNPSGRPKVCQEAQELARQHGPDAIRRLASLMEKGESDHVRLNAAVALLDRGYGKPAQTVNSNVTRTDVRQLSDEELASALARVEAALAGGDEAEERPSITH